MLLLATDLCWVTCTSFTTLVLFHVKDAKMFNYSAMKDFQTRVTKFMSFELSNYTFQLPEFWVAPLFAVMLARNFSVHLYWTLPCFSHVCNSSTLLWRYKKTFKYG